MNNALTLNDKNARQQALDPATSFIVQAPAGSGKTGLLTQRYLKLLTLVETPEEIVAITFTRKAASEMRERILTALDRANDPEVPKEKYRALTQALARQALERNNALHWNLQENPTRLRIQTIDSLNASIIQQMPILSRLGNTPMITDDPDALYLEAAKNTLEELETNPTIAKPIARLLQHMDNRAHKCQKLIATMLQHREQWLRHTLSVQSSPQARKTLEATLSLLITSTLKSIKNRVPAHLEQEIFLLLGFSSSRQPEMRIPIPAGRPNTSLEDRAFWEYLANMLLTKEGEWRKKVDKRQGFPAKSEGKNKEEKAQFYSMKLRMQELLHALHDSEDFRIPLATLLRLPSHQYRQDDWEVLKAFNELLRQAAAHLELVFQKSGKMDFPALSLAAIQALGCENNPTDLALALDYRINHLLVDEFQDTSQNQFELLKRLTVGWQPDDGRSLFLVGDPMQSIYRFREAEVGLFLHVITHGWGNIAVTPLQLSSNFRSQQGIIHWVNDNFPNIFPATNNIATGAVAYNPSASTQPELSAPAVQIHPTLDRDDEAQKILTLVQKAREMHPHGVTAVLVRSRNHLTKTIRLLQQNNILFHAVEIERLTHRPIIQDLLALTRALIHRGDRIAWLAVTRAPYIGLSLSDCHALTAGRLTSTLFELLNQPDRIALLSPDGQLRAQRVLPILNSALANQFRFSLRQYVEETWAALGGPACIRPSDLNDVEVFFQLLESLEHDSNPPDIHTLIKKVEKLYSQTNPSTGSALQLMTIHKSKGLEFDTVILPGLGYTPRPNEKKLLSWTELMDDRGLSHLLMAPINSVIGNEKNPIADYIKHLEEEKSHFENGRLLYVAITRAKQYLHLLGHLPRNKGNQALSSSNKPAKKSLLKQLWPAVHNDYQKRLEQELPQENTPPPVIEKPNSPGRIRLRSNFALPKLISAWHLPQKLERLPQKNTIEFSWATETLRHIGTVVHRLLQIIAEKSLEKFTQKDHQKLKYTCRALLLQQNLPRDQFEPAQTTIQTAIDNTLNDKRGQWLLSNKHQQARCEWALSVRHVQGIENIVIDRTFIDDSGIRWIIDYKTSRHDGEGANEFLQEEQNRYKNQLERYAEALKKMGGHRIRLGLYFPLLKAWREWPYEQY